MGQGLCLPGAPLTKADRAAFFVGMAIGVVLVVITVVVLLNVDA
jgi:tetrahydromethanopterin S-methyltransferase subunit F